MLYLSVKIWYYCELLVPSTLIEQYMQNRRGLKLIQAISLWGSQKLKIEYLYLSSEVQVMELIETIYNNEVLSESTRKVKNKLKSIYSLKYPYENDETSEILHFL